MFICQVFSFFKASQMLGGSYIKLTTSSFIGFLEEWKVRGKHKCWFSQAKDVEMWYRSEPK